jgi:hypothetical protein
VEELLQVYDTIDVICMKMTLKQRYQVIAIPCLTPINTLVAATRLALDNVLGCVCEGRTGEGLKVTEDDVKILAIVHTR